MYYLIPLCMCLQVLMWHESCIHLVMHLETWSAIVPGVIGCYRCFNFIPPSLRSPDREWSSTGPRPRGISPRRVPPDPQPSWGFHCCLWSSANDFSFRCTSNGWMPCTLIYPQSPCPPLQWAFIVYTTPSCGTPLPDLHISLSSSHWPAPSAAPRAPWAQTWPPALSWGLGSSPCKNNTFNTV